MSIMHTRWLVSGLFVSALAATGCDVSVGNCDDDAGECDVNFDEEDASARDGSVKADASADGGGLDGSTDGGGGADGSVDGSAPDATGAPLTLEKFCIATLAKAVAWRDALGDACFSKNAGERDGFLQNNMGYRDTSEDECVTKRQASITANTLTFDGTHAAACAEAYTAQFDAPPSSFPSAGLDIVSYEATVGHGGVALQQIPECRLALVGKVTSGKPCADSFECVSGYRCLPAPGNTTTCQTAVTVGTCSKNSDCADGLICAGSSAGGGRTCIKNDLLVSNGSNCALSTECSKGSVCDANKCVAATPFLICKP